MIAWVCNTLPAVRRPGAQVVVALSYPTVSQAQTKTHRSHTAVNLCSAIVSDGRFIHLLYGSKVGRVLSLEKKIVDCCWVSDPTRQKLGKFFLIIGCIDGSVWLYCVEKENVPVAPKSSSKFVSRNGAKRDYFVNSQRKCNIIRVSADTKGRYLTRIPGLQRIVCCSSNLPTDTSSVVVLSSVSEKALAFNVSELLNTIFSPSYAESTSQKICLSQHTLFKSLSTVDALVSSATFVEVRCLKKNTSLPLQKFTKDGKLYVDKNKSIDETIGTACHDDGGSGKAINLVKADSDFQVFNHLVCGTVCNGVRIQPWNKSHRSETQVSNISERDDEVREASSRMLAEERNSYHMMPDEDVVGVHYLNPHQHAADSLLGGTLVIVSRCGVVHLHYTDPASPFVQFEQEVVNKDSHMRGHFTCRFVHEFGSLMEILRSWLYCIPCQQNGIVSEMLHILVVLTNRGVMCTFIPSVTHVFARLMDEASRVDNFKSTASLREGELPLHCRSLMNVPSMDYVLDGNFIHQEDLKSDSLDALSEPNGIPPAHIVLVLRRGGVNCLSLPANLMETVYRELELLFEGSKPDIQHQALRDSNDLSQDARTRNRNFVSGIVEKQSKSSGLQFHIKHLLHQIGAVSAMAKRRVILHTQVVQQLTYLEACSRLLRRIKLHGARTILGCRINIKPLRPCVNTEVPMLPPELVTVVQQQWKILQQDCVKNDQGLVECFQWSLVVTITPQRGQDSTGIIKGGASTSHVFTLPWTAKDLETERRHFTSYNHDSEINFRRGAHNSKNMPPSPYYVQRSLDLGGGFPSVDRNSYSKKSRTEDRNTTMRVHSVQIAKENCFAPIVVSTHLRLHICLDPSKKLHEFNSTSITNNAYACINTHLMSKELFGISNVDRIPRDLVGLYGRGSSSTTFPMMHMSQDIVSCLELSIGSWACNAAYGLQRRSLDLKNKATVQSSTEAMQEKKVTSNIASASCGLPPDSADPDMFPYLIDGDVLRISKKSIDDWLRSLASMDTKHFEIVGMDRNILLQLFVTFDIPIAHAAMLNLSGSKLRHNRNAAQESEVNLDGIGDLFLLAQTAHIHHGPSHPEAASIVTIVEEVSSDFRNGSKQSIGSSSGILRISVKSPSGPMAWASAHLAFVAAAKQVTNRKPLPVSEKIRRELEILAFSLRELQRTTQETHRQLVKPFMRQLESDTEAASASGSVLGTTEKTTSRLTVTQVAHGVHSCLCGIYDAYEKLRNISAAFELH